jgi:hypothetical protein
VNKSLSYQVVGYSNEGDDEALSSPDKVAAFMMQNLATDTESPLRSRIIIAPQANEALTAISTATSWYVLVL